MIRVTVNVAPETGRSLNRFSALSENSPSGRRINERPARPLRRCVQTPSGSRESDEKERISRMLTIGLAAAWFAIAMTGFIAVGDYRAK